MQHLLTNFASNFAYELISGSGGLGLKMGKFPAKVLIHEWSYHMTLSAGKHRRHKIQIHVCSKCIFILVRI